MCDVYKSIMENCFNLDDSKRVMGQIQFLGTTVYRGEQREHFSTYHSVKEGERLCLFNISCIEETYPKTTIYH